jgi:hypothetical protein
MCIPEKRDEKTQKQTYNGKGKAKEMGGSIQFLSTLKGEAACAS